MGDAQVPYVVSSPSASGTVALVAPVTTWQAYNEWGGYSLYVGPDGDRRSWAVSFDRPYDGSTGANDYRTAAIPIVVRAERLHRQLGIPLSYYTNVDLDQDPDVLDGARGYVSMGHDEYWTPAMREAVERARDGGTNLAFLGANTMYWRIRLDDADSGPARLQTGYRHDAHLDPLRDQRPAQATSRFRDEPAAESEQTLVGHGVRVLPGRRRPHRRVAAAGGAFAGTGVRLGDRLPRARRPRGRPRLPRREHAAPDGGAQPHAVLLPRGDDLQPRRSTTRRARAPVSSARGRCAGAAPWSTRASARWARACSGSCAGDRQRPARRSPTDRSGAEHPARDTVTRYPLPDVNSVDAS